ncbi:MAG: transposase family protein [Acidobacteria bacterium]|nr:transposase family protein [Acidobacteriota bacterium]
MYPINAVDEVTQWQVVGAASHISEAWLMPVLQAILAQFPFVVLHFHSDNGSEFINHVVAELLKKLLIEQAKSRPRRFNDGHRLRGSQKRSRDPEADGLSAYWGRARRTHP